MERLARTLAGMEDSLVALERRGVSLRAHALRQDPVSLKLPVFHVFYGSEEHWFTNREQLDEFIKQHEEKSGGELNVSDTAAAVVTGAGAGRVAAVPVATARGAAQAAPAARKRRKR